MNDSEALVELALRTLSCKQKELAVRLGVSPAQISKWKKGEYMSIDMDQKLREITGIGQRDPELVLRSDSPQDVDKWEKLIRYLADSARHAAETGYETVPLLDEYGLLCPFTFSTLRDMGVEVPKKFPEELDFEYDSDDENFDLERTCEILFEENPYSSLIYKIYISLNDVYGFYAAYLSSMLLEEVFLEEGVGENIEPSLLNLAASKIEVDKGLASDFGNFKHRVTKEYEEWINDVKETAFKAGIPLKAELLELVYDDHEALGVEAEAESLGFNSSRIHPDIYMNELLQGMRAIHQILPVIMKKLDIYDEFNLDETQLTARGTSSHTNGAEKAHETEDEGDDQMASKDDQMDNEEVGLDYEVIDAMLKAGTNPVFIYGYLATTRIVTEANLKFMTEEDLAEWNQVTREAAKFLPKDPAALAERIKVFTELIHEKAPLGICYIYLRTGLRKPDLETKLPAKEEKRWQEAAKAWERIVELYG